MNKYQVETYTLFDGWVNCETDGDGKKVYYSTAEEAQDSINQSVKEWNEDIDSGNNEFGTHYDVDEYRVIKAKN